SLPSPRATLSSVRADDRPVISMASDAILMARWSGGAGMDGDTREVPAAVDSCCPWLLRVGIDHSGKLDPTRLWDYGVRGAILADLWLSGRVVDVGESLQIDTDPTGIPYLDTAILQLVDSGQTPYEWMGRGWLRATDVADEFVRDGEWTV